jgi:hypothetical protein
VVDTFSERVLPVLVEVKIDTGALETDTAALSVSSYHNLIDWLLIVVFWLRAPVERPYPIAGKFMPSGRSAKQPPGTGRITFLDQGVYQMGEV